jgi:phosphatidate cytidylyltransferase
MLAQRIWVGLVLIPVGVLTILLGGWSYLAIILIFLGMAAWEYTHIFRIGGHQPATAVVVGGTILLTLGRAHSEFASAPWLLSLLTLAAMAYHLWKYERGRDQAALDFALTIGGFMYLGWIGAYFLSLRSLPQGEWWTLIILPSVWVADTAAYFIGRRWGRHKMTPRLSPHKSWEGYIAGVIGAMLFGWLLTLLFSQITSLPDVFPAWKGVFLGFVMGTAPILGDLGESMIKRQFGVKDSGHSLPGHGGFFDRIDSWLWAAVIGYSLLSLV